MHLSQRGRVSDYSICLEFCYLNLCLYICPQWTTGSDYCSNVVLSHCCSVVMSKVHLMVLWGPWNRHIQLIEAWDLPRSEQLSIKLLVEGLK